MTKLKLFGAVAVLSTMIATPLFAQAAIQEPGAYAFYHSHDNTGTGYTQFAPREAYGFSGAPVSIGHKFTRAAHRNRHR